MGSGRENETEDREQLKAVPVKQISTENATRGAPDATIRMGASDLTPHDGRCTANYQSPP